MMNKTFLLLVFLLFGAIGYSQTIDYNTKKGYAVYGYDVVSYFDGKPVEGNNAFTTKYDGINYKFINKSNMDKFVAEPTAYLPEYGGYCAYAVAINAKKVNVDPETFEIRNGKLYLFYNKGKNNTLQFWLNESPDKLKNKADKNWEEIKN